METDSERNSSILPGKEMEIEVDYMTILKPSKFSFEICSDQRPINSWIIFLNSVFMTVTIIQFPTSYQFSALLPHLILFFSFFFFYFPVLSPLGFIFYYILWFFLSSSFLLFFSFLFSPFLFSSLIKVHAVGCPPGCMRRQYTQWCAIWTRSDQALMSCTNSLVITYVFSSPYYSTYHCLPCITLCLSLNLIFSILHLSWHQTIRYSSTLSFSSSSSSHAAINVSIPIYFFFIHFLKYRSDRGLSYYLFIILFGFFYFRHILH